MPKTPKNLRKILVTVKTYPTLSTSHTETVCTAGIDEKGKWVRIFPVPFRCLEKNKQFKKYQWIEADIEKDTRDPRPESHKLNGKIKLLDFIDTDNCWEERKRHVLGKVYYNLETLIDEARDVDIFTSLAVFKPTKIINFKLEEDKNKFSKRIKRKIIKDQIGEEKARYLVENVNYKFLFTVVDNKGKKSTMQVIDWEIYQLCRKLIKKFGNRKSILQKELRAKYFDYLVNNKDLYLFLGTNKYWHIRRSNNPFMIIGVFYPPRIKS